MIRTKVTVSYWEYICFSYSLGNLNSGPILTGSERSFMEVLNCKRTKETSVCMSPGENCFFMIL